MTAQTIAVFVALGLVMLWLDRGLERERLFRCHACGSRYGEKHAADCPWKDKT